MAHKELKDMQAARRDVTLGVTDSRIPATELARKRELRLAVVQLIAIGLGGVVVVVLFFTMTVAALSL